MLKFVLAGGLVVGSSMAFGASFLKAPTAGFVPHAKAPVEGECADFSGSWAGTCKDQDGETYSETLKIEQYGCSDITVDGEDLKIDGVKSETNQDAKSYTNITIMPEWSADKTQIEATMIMNGKGFGENAYRFAGEGHGGWRLDGDSLSSEFTFKGVVHFSGTTKDFSSTSSCTYQKAE